MRQTADVVVIGSGGFGAATAYFLAKRGQKVALVDKFGISSQTSPRAAGLASTIRATDIMTRLASRAGDLLVGFEGETGRSLGAIRAGSVKIAREPEDVPVLERDAETSRRYELGARMISPDDVSEYNPLLKPDGILAALHIPTDVYFEPQQVAIGFAVGRGREGRQPLPEHAGHGRSAATVPATTGASSASTRSPGRSTHRSSSTPPARGPPECARLAGFEMPLVPMRHQLFITQPIDGVRPEHAMFRFIDSAVYARPCWGGVLLGGYEPKPVAIDIDAQARRSRSADVTLDWTVLRALADASSGRCRSSPTHRSASTAAACRRSPSTATTSSGPVPGAERHVRRRRLQRVGPVDVAGDRRAARRVDLRRPPDGGPVAHGTGPLRARVARRGRRPTASAAEHYTTFYRSTI